MIVSYDERIEVEMDLIKNNILWSGRMKELDKNEREIMDEYYNIIT